MAGGGRIGNVVGQGFIGGRIAEMVLLTGTVSPADRETMEGYLAHKWGLTTNLPLAHPYKSTPPGGSSATAGLDATVTDADGQTPSLLWTKVSGPGLVTFAATTAVDTTVTFTQAGTYVLRLTANDGVVQVSDDVVITVNPADSGPLAVTIADAEISEDGGATTATITRTGATGDLQVSLLSSDTGEATVPSTATIPHGSSSVDVTITGVPDSIVDGNQTVTITASAAGYSPGGDTLVVTDGQPPGPGPIHHFAISSIASPQTVGTAITGITITAQDTANLTATSFTGTVTFGGTAGITGTSANFVGGILGSVTVTPTVTGSNLTLAVNDGAGHTGSTTFTVRSLFDSWAGGSGLSGGNATAGANPDGDSLTNLLEFAFGMNPTSPVVAPLSYVPNGTTIPGTPILEKAGATYRAVFARRKDYQTAGLNYTVWFTADLTRWTTVGTPPVRLSGNNTDPVETVSIDFPASVPWRSGVPAYRNFSA